MGAYFLQNARYVTFWSKEARFGDIIRGEVTAKMDEILTIEEPSIDECIPAIIDIRSRMKQVSRLWEIEPHQRLWYVNNVMLFIL